MKRTHKEIKEILEDEHFPLPLQKAIVSQLLEDNEILTKALRKILEIGKGEDAQELDIAREAIEKVSVMEDPLKPVRNSLSSLVELIKQRPALAQLLVKELYEELEATEAKLAEAVKVIEDLHCVIDMTGAGYIEAELEVEGLSCAWHGASKFLSKLRDERSDFLTKYSSKEG